MTRRGLLLPVTSGTKSTRCCRHRASRLKDTYYKPVIVLAINGDEATGSGRCIEGMNLADSLVACTELLVKHGGHAAAAGLTLKTKNIPKFKTAFNKYACEHLTEEALQPKLDLEFETHLSLLTLDMLKELEQFEPFGKDNPSPLFGARRVKVDGRPSQIGKDKNHLRMFVSDGKVKRCALEWGQVKSLSLSDAPICRSTSPFHPKSTSGKAPIPCSSSLVTGRYTPKVET